MWVFKTFVKVTPGSIGVPVYCSEFSEILVKIRLGHKKPQKKNKAVAAYTLTVFFLYKIHYKHCTYQCYDPILKNF